MTLEYDGPAQVVSKRHPSHPDCTDDGLLKVCYVKSWARVMSNPRPMWRRIRDPHHVEPTYRERLTQDEQDHLETRSDVYYYTKTGVLCDFGAVPADHGQPGG